MNLNDLSDDALRLALGRALERNAHLEGLLSSIGDAVGSLDKFRPEWMSAERYVKLAYGDYDDEDAYLADQAWVLEQREEQEEGEEPYPFEHECPFFSERFLYSIFGKDDARSILSRFERIQRLATENDSEMKRRRERMDDLLRAARGVLRDYETLERIDRYLDPDETWMKHRSKTDEELRADRDELVKRMLRSAEHLAQIAAWFPEDL